MARLGLAPPPNDTPETQLTVCVIRVIHDCYPGRVIGRYPVSRNTNVGSTLRTEREGEEGESENEVLRSAIVQVPPPASQRGGSEKMYNSSLEPRAL